MEKEKKPRAEMSDVAEIWRFKVARPSGKYAGENTTNYPANPGDRRAHVRLWWIQMDGREKVEDLGQLPTTPEVNCGSAPVTIAIADLHGDNDVSSS